MNKLLFLIAVALSATSTVAEADLHNNKTSKTSYGSLTGGELIKKGSFAGCVAIIDEQNQLANSDISDVAKILAEATLCNVIATTDPKYSADFVVRVVHDNQHPLMLIAPEDKWAIVNVKKIADGVRAGQSREKLFVGRARKEIIKAFSLLCGGGSSQFPGNIMNTPDLKSLDMVPEQIPMDMVGYYQAYLSAHGVTPKEMTTYKIACREGWAPLPTNDVQQVIWNRVHEIPTEPIKIKFAP